MKKLKFIFGLLIIMSTTVLPAQSEFIWSGVDTPFYMGKDTIIIYDGIIKIQNDTITLVETLDGFYINENCHDVYIVAKKNYVETTGNYVLYNSLGEYQFWIRVDPITGEIIRFSYTSFTEFKTIEG